MSQSDRLTTLDFAEKPQFHQLRSLPPPTALRPTRPWAWTARSRRRNLNGSSRLQKTSQRLQEPIFVARGFDASEMSINMPAFAVQLDIGLDVDKLVDIIAVQWHTPAPLTNGRWRKIPPDNADAKRVMLGRLKEWLAQEFAAPSERPLFILFPELSVPLAQHPLLAELINAMTRPAILIAGLEYLTWTEFTDLLHGMNAMPGANAWEEGGRADSVVNAAIIYVRDRRGGIQRFIQPKRHPENHERIYLHSGRHFLIYRSQSQMPGVRLNFAAHICSDFASHRNVQQFRRECATACPGMPLDITFLLQWNEDQHAAQFKQAVQAYFEPPDAMTETEQGVLVFVNNANEVCGKSPLFGRSQFIYKFTQRWRDLASAPPTYWLVDERANDHQAVVLREAGPSVYWLLYKPCYLVSRIAGGDQPTPFPESKALWSHCKHLPGGPEAALSFSRLGAVCHWLESEWRHYESVLGGTLAAEVRDGRLVDADVQLVKTSYQTAMTGWSQAFGNRDGPARNALLTLFAACKTDGYPSQTIEPNQWCPDAEKAVHHMLRTYAMLKLGELGFGPTGISFCTDGVAHALRGHDIRISLLWGNGEQLPESMISGFLAERGARGAADMLAKTAVVVALSPSGIPPKQEILERFRGSQISEGAANGTAGAHLQPGGDVVRVEEPELRLIYDTELWGELNRRDASLQERLSRVIVEALR
jgi:hypothetical protein